MSKKIEVRIELSTRDLFALRAIAEELGKIQDLQLDEDILVLLEKIAGAFEKAAGKVKKIT
jgi:hypothetical protein